MTATAIWWIRRDLRLSDNQALQAAISTGLPVTPLFILDEHLLERPAPLRQGFLFAGLRQLDAQLNHCGCRLIIRKGDPATTLHNFIAGLGDGPHPVFAIEDTSPYARQRDAKVADLVSLTLLPGQTIFPPATVSKPDGSPYTIFTPFCRAWRALPPQSDPQPASLRLTSLPGLESDEIPSTPPPPDFPPGEAEALRRLNRFIDGPIDEYAAGRDRMDLDGTSQLSPYLRFGMVSARQVYAAARSAFSREENLPGVRQSCEVFINELIWREFYNSILYHFPQVMKTSFNPTLRNIRWQNAPQLLQAWKNGQTGYPVVDAAMRQLTQTGWMHNRARMITASFLVKDLLINWQEGERWFMQTLVDGDPAANNGGWQWTAGTGTDAAPYFRVFNPTLQGKKYDPEGTFIRRWVPELAKVPTRYIHEPWLMPESTKETTGCRPGKTYPLPIIDHKDARQRALQAYRA